MTRILIAALLILATASSTNAAELFHLSWGTTGSAIGYSGAGAQPGADTSPSGPNAIAVASNGRIHVADTQNDSVLVLDATGTVVGRLGARGRPELEQVCALAPMDGGELLAGLGRCGDIVRIGRAGDVKPFYRSPSRGSGRIGQLQGLAVDSASGLVYAGDVAGGRILCLSSAGQLLASIPWALSGFAVGPGGDLYRLVRRDRSAYVLVARGVDGTDRDVYRLPTPGSGETLPGEDEIGANRTVASSVFASPRILGFDLQGGLILRHVDPAKPGKLLVRRYSPDGKSSRELGELRANGADEPFAVTTAGKVLAMDFDASQAPAGSVVMQQLQ